MDRLIAFLEQFPFVLGDGAMGTTLQAAGLPPGATPDEWNVSHPDVVRAVHQGYVDAGAQVITTNSFGGNRYRLARDGLQDRVHSLNRAAALLAREVADGAAHAVLVAGSMGPTGEILAPLGALEPEEVAAAYAEQAAALAEGGADFLLIETMSALEEVEAAVQGARRACSLPIAVTMTFDTNFRTMMGVKPAQAVKALHAMGIRVLGANCGNGPQEMERVAAEMMAARPEDVFLVTQSNAGVPDYDPVTGQTRFNATPEDMADYARKMMALGVRYIGACCGSTAAHIRAMAEALRGA